MIKLLTISLLSVILSFPAIAQNQDFDEALKTLESFTEAIIQNDREKASELLKEDARILETGGIETKDEYLSHHFHSDGNFLSAMKREITSQKITPNGNTVWISTISNLSGIYNEREIDVSSAELAVLVFTGDKWKISALHWSSRNNN